MEIKIATKSDKEAWDTYVLAHPEGVSYHRFAWGQAVQQAYGFEPQYYKAVEGSVLKGVFPCIHMKIPILGSCLVSLPYCDLGGVLADNDVIADALLSYSVDNARQCKNKSFEVRQSDNKNEKSNTNKVRMILALPGSSDELMSGFKAKLRSQIKKPVKDGLTSELGGVNLLSDFYRIMSINMRDLGSPVHSLSWFEEVLRHYGEDAKVCVVRNAEGEAIASGMILLHSENVSIPWASTLRKYNRLNPNMLLYWTFLSLAADSGFKTFDFGRSTPGEGTYKFKKQWGAEPVPLDWRNLLCSEIILTESGKGSVRQVVENIWSKLPVSVATLLGSRLRPYISL